MKEKNKRAGYIVVLRPFGSDERNPKKIGECEDDSRKFGICGMGWPEDFFTDENYYNVADYMDEYIDNNRSKGKTTAANKYKKIKKDDFVLTRFLDGTCWIGKVKRKAYHRNYNKDPFEAYYRYSWVTNVDWKVSMKFHELPSAIQGVMSGRINTIKELDDLYTNILGILYGDKTIKKWILDIDNFHKSLSPEDLENLVAFYLKKKFKSYFLIPSTCKKDYPLYEFVMINPVSEEKITCQVKNNVEVIAKDYQSNYFDTIFLFSGKDKYGSDYYEGKYNNIKIIKREELFTILKKQFEKEAGIFYDELKDYYIIKE